MRRIRDPNREAAQPMDNFLLGKKNKPQFGIMIYRDLYNLWKGKGFSTLIFLFRLRKPTLREVNIGFPSQRVVMLRF